MKKKLLAILLAAATVFSMAACGSDNENENQDANDAFVLSEENLDSYVTLNEGYDVFNVEIAPIEVTDDTINTQIDNLIYDKAADNEKLQNLVNRPVENGDVVMIDYVGTKDGEAFAGGTSTSATDLTIGSGQFIPGFEDGLIGVNPGETVVLDLTFPENYSSTELAGQAVQFEVTVHYILPTYKDITDEFAADLYEGMNTIAELREQVSKDIYDATYAENVEYAVVGLMETKCTYGEELPEELNQISYDNIMSNLETYAGYYGLDLETYVYMSYYEDLETFKNGTAWDIASYSTKHLLFCQAYANEKDLNVTEDELKEQLEVYALYYGYASADELPAEEIESIKNTMMNLKVLDHIIANATVTFTEATDDVTAE